VWPRSRGRSEGKPRPGGPRWRREGLHRALRGGERNVAQRVPERTPDSRGTESDHRAVKAGLSVETRGAAKANSSAYRRLAKGEYRARTEQACSANGRGQSLGLRKETNRILQSAVTLRRVAALCFATAAEATNCGP